ncbi:hypothetical protein [Streptosporangium minutum]|nr:hypothetical protein [Streptosporangium minutum]
MEKAADGEPYLYPGDQHLFAGSSPPSYDAGGAALLPDRTPAFLGSR